MSEPDPHKSEASDQNTSERPKPKKHKRRSSTRAHAVVAVAQPPAPPAPNPVGRPLTYTPELAKSLCERVAAGEMLYKICEEAGSPGITTVYRWMEQFDDFRDNYERARKVKAEHDFDRLQQIADDGTNDWMEARDREGAIIGWRINGEAVQRSRLRAETLKWRLSMINPHRYATIQRQELSGPGGGPIEVLAMEVRQKLRGMVFDGLKVEPKPDDADSHTEEIEPESQ